MVRRTQVTSLEEFINLSYFYVGFQLTCRVGFYSKQCTRKEIKLKIIFPITIDAPDCGWPLLGFLSPQQMS